MAKARSPSYPALSLRKAVEIAGKVYEKNHTHKASSEVVAKAMGYSGLNGKSLTAIATLKKFGLLEEVDKQLRVTQAALTVLVDPRDSVERAKTILRLAFLPDLFAELRAEYGDVAPNDELLRSYLLKRGFLLNTVDLPVRAYRETMELVGEVRRIAEPGDAPDPVTPSVDEPMPVSAKSVDASADVFAGVDGKVESGVNAASPAAHAVQALERGEREWLRGPLSKDVSYRLIVTGEIGPREIGRLIRLLTAQKDVLEDDFDSE